VTIVVKSERPDQTSLNAISLADSLNIGAANDDDDAFDDDCGDFENELADPADSAGRVGGKGAGRSKVAGMMGLG